MKILQINSVCGIGSTGRIVTDIDNMLKERGHESYVAYGRNESINCDTAIKIGSTMDVFAHIAKTRVTDRHGFGSKKSTIEFIDQISEMNFDVIHLHNIHGYYINIEVLFDYLKVAGKPVIWTLHDCWAFTGHCSHFDYMGCDKWIDGCYRCPQKESYPRSFVKDNSKLNYNNKKELFTGIENLIIVTPSKWLANLVEKSFLKSYPIQVIHNGIDLESFKPTKGYFRNKYTIEDKFIILGVSNGWSMKKGFDFFLKLSERLHENQVIVLVGVSEKEIERLPKNIIGINKTIDVNELAEIYSTANVFLNPTLEDNFPTTNLEALACGTPVITFDTGGSSESIAEFCGFVVEKNDLDGVLNTFSLLTQKEMYTINCLIHSQEYFNKEDRFQEYITLYSSITSIDKKSKSSQTILDA